jgi:hypothetical protein
MAELTLDHSFLPVSEIHTYSIVDVAADANEIFAGAYVQQTAGGYAVIVGDSGGLGVGPVIGVNERNVPDQTGASDGDAQSNVYQGLFKRPIAASSPVTDADMFKTVYAGNNFDVTRDSLQPVLGVMVGIDNDAGKCTVLVSGAPNAALATTGMASIPIPLNSWTLANGTPLAVFADGVSTVPGTSYNDSKAFGIRWNNDAAPGGIATGIPIPDDMDRTHDAVLVVVAAKVGATSADLPTMTIEAFFHEVGAAYDADTDAGGSTNAMTDLATKVSQLLALIIDAADIPASSSLGLTLTLTPEAGKLATDDLVILSTRLLYTRK